MWFDYGTDVRMKWCELISDESTHRKPGFIAFEDSVEETGGRVDTGSGRLDWLGRCGWADVESGAGRLDSLGRFSWADVDAGAGRLDWAGGSSFDVGAAGVAGARRSDAGIRDLAGAFTRLRFELVGF